MKVVSSTLLVALSLVGCASVSYVKDELTGSAKPAGGITEVIPPSKTYAANPATLRRAVLAILEEQGEWSR